MTEEENERDFMKACFNAVAGLEVKNESQAIAKEVILDEVENLTKENKQLKEVIDNAIGIVEHNRIISEKNRKIRQLEKQIYSDKKELCNRLISNWNKLKKYLTNRYNNGTESINYRDSFLEIIAIMQELEQGSDSDE